MGFDDNSSGISEVFGVMLMLTITLIIACMVAAFASGQSFTPEEDSISANIVASELVIGNYHSAYIIFDHLSGDPVDLNNIDISLAQRSSAGSRTSVSNQDTPTGVMEDGEPLIKYIVSYGDVDDTKVTVGDRFVLYADRWDDAGGEVSVYWERDGADNSFSVPENDYIEYRIIDRRSGRAVSTGSIPVPSC